MAGRPKARAARLEAAAQVDATAKRVDQMRQAMIADGLDPDRYDTEAPRQIAQLEDYAPGLALRMMRLAGEGLSLEEIRADLGFTEDQERAWSQQYVDFASAVTRVHARERAFWHSQARIAAQAGDRAGWQAATTLIAKRFEGGQAQGDASQLIHVHIGKPLDKRTDGEG